MMKSEVQINGVNIAEALLAELAGQLTEAELAQLNELLAAEDYMAALELAERLMQSKRGEAAELFAQAEQMYGAGDYEAAMQQAEAALQIDGANVRGLLLLAKIAEKFPQPTAIIAAALEKAVKLPEFNDLPLEMQLIVLKKLAHIYGNTNKMAELLALQKNIARLTADKKEKRLMYSSYLYIMQIAALYDKADMLAENAAYERLLAQSKPYSHGLIKHQHRRIRVGYLSVDYCQHPVAFFTLKLLYFHDKTRFETFCYSGTKNCDKVTAQLEDVCDNWRDISRLDDTAAAKLIRRDKLDILFDLGGHTVCNRLPVMAQRPAPVQLSGIGYIGTTGMSSIDYFLTDKYCDNEAGAGDFTERLLALPHSHFCYTMRDDAKPPQPAPCTRNGYITYGSFNRVEKITDAMLQLWSEIMRQTPNSILVLKSSFSEDDFFADCMKKRLLAVGIALDRVSMQGATVNYLDEYLNIDIALDTFPCCGGTTTCDALIMGVPVITLTGERHVSRFGYSIMKNAGLTEFIAADEAEYIAKAVSLANNPELLNDYHLRLRSLMIASPVMDGALYARSLEDAYCRIIDEYNKKLSSGGDRSC